MDDMNLFNRFHAAFEEEPPRGAFERLQSDLIKHSAARRARPAFQMRWSRMSLRLTAAVAVVVIAIALVAAYIAAQRTTVGGVPAGSSGDVAGYQSLVQRDYNAWVSAPFHCHSVTDSACVTDVANNQAIVLKWRSDLSSFRTPNQFAVIDAQMRKHLDAALKKFADEATAVNNTDQSLLDSAVFYGAIDVTWLAHAARGIAGSHVATASQYLALVNAYRPSPASICATLGCQQDTILGDCLAISDPLCPHDVTTDSDYISTMQADFVGTVAPTELSDQSLTLQMDLAQADSALMAASNALLQNDSGGLKSARGAYLDAMTAVASDLQS
jgi:hypothetical protein